MINKLLKKIEEYIPKYHGDCMCVNKDQFLVKLYYNLRYFYYRAKHKTMGWLKNVRKENVR